MTPKKGYDDKKYKANYDDIIWSSTRKDYRKNKQGLMNSASKVHKDTKQDKIDKEHKKEINESL